MSASKAETILTGFLFVNLDAIIKIFLSSVFQVHISSGELDLIFFLLGNYCYVVNCIVFGVSKEVMESVDAFIGPDLQRNLSVLKMC